MFKQSQHQKQLQRLMPQIIQKQNLLAIPTIALEQMVKLEMEINPFLEEVNEMLEEHQDDEAELNPADSADESEEVIEPVKKEDEEFDTDDYVNSEYEGYKTDESIEGEEKTN